MNELMEIWKFLKKTEFYSRRGLFIYCLLWLFFWWFISVKLLPVYNIVPSLKRDCFMYSVPLIIMLFFWLQHRCSKFDIKENVCAIAIKTKDSSINYKEEIIKQLKEQRRTYRLEDKIKIIDLPSDVYFENQSDAEKYISRRNIRLLIWGNTSEGKIKGDQSTRFNISLSYLFSYVKSKEDLEDKSKNNIIYGIDQAIKRNYWTINDFDSFSAISVVSGNIFEISLFSIGVCLASNPEKGDRMTAINILEKLLSIIKKRNPDANFPQLSIVRKQVISLLIFLYGDMARLVWLEGGDILNSIELFNKIFLLNNNDWATHQNISTLYWISGDKSNAKFHTRRAIRINPNHPATRLNKAFLLIDSRKYDFAGREYKKIKSISGVDAMTTLNIMEPEIEKQSDNHGFLFAVGWFNINFMDSNRGEEQLKKFLDVVQENEEYRELINIAKGLLNRKKS